MHGFSVCPVASIAVAGVADQKRVKRTRPVERAVLTLAAVHDALCVNRGWTL